MWYTGKYKNLFVELCGYTAEEVNKRIEAMKNYFFYGAEDQRIYYENPDNTACIYDTGYNEIRSEGMSYGMMVTVQLDMKKEFDKLWAWAKLHMQHPVGDDRAGYFAWHCDRDGNILDADPAPDGEQYFAMALYFAWKRWVDAAYKEEADFILDSMLHQGERTAAPEVRNIFVEYADDRIVCFVPNGEYALYTDPSYHLPAFYALWALWADKDNNTWRNIAKASRRFLKTTINPSTGLGPDYANFNGSGRDEGRGHAAFRYDAWRTTMNIAVDFYWWGEDSWAVTQADTIQAFFAGQGLSTHGSLYALDGTSLGGDHSPGLVAVNAIAGLTTSNSKRAGDFARELWNTAFPSGKWRYYDGCLYMFAMLHLSGNFKIYGREE